MDPQILQEILLQQQIANTNGSFAKIKKSYSSKKPLRPQTAKVSQSYGKFIKQQKSQKLGNQSDRGKPSISQSKRRHSKKAKKAAATIQHEETNFLVADQQQMPVFNEEYLNQLNEEQLQELLL